MKLGRRRKSHKVQAGLLRYCENRLARFTTQHPGNGLQNYVTTNVIKVDVNATAFVMVRITQLNTSNTANGNHNLSIWKEKLSS